MTFIQEVSEGKLDYDWPAQVNKLLVEGGFDLILSIGQVVPHEVIGMANYNKNIFVGTGGAEGINKSHFLGAVYGMERIMGRADTPVRRVLNYASRPFRQAPADRLCTDRRRSPCRTGRSTRGLFIGDDIECFNQAAELSLKVNFQMLDKPLKKVVVYLDPEEFKSTWLGNKSIYRTRMAMADGGELIVLAPGLKEFGEDKEIDRLIRKYGYVGTDRVLELTQEECRIAEQPQRCGPPDSRLIRRTIQDHLLPRPHQQGEIESVNFPICRPEDDDCKIIIRRNLRTASNTVNGEEMFFISNPGMGLWSWKERFK